MTHADDDDRPDAPDTSDDTAAATRGGGADAGALAGAGLDGLVTPAWAPSRSGAERAGTDQGLADAEREAKAPGPTEVHVASDEYLDVPRPGGVTASDVQV